MHLASSPFLVLSAFLLCTHFIGTVHADQTKRASHHQHARRDDPRYSWPHARSTLGKTKSDFFVNGTEIPGVPFTVPDSYAGVISAAKDDSKGFFFWLQYGHTDDAKQRLTISLTGCSGLTGVLQSTGDWMLPYDSNDVPVTNEYAWSKLSNVLYVDYTTMLGSSFGPAVDGSEAAASDFLVFLQNFYNIFPELQGMKLWFVGEGKGATAVDWILYKMLLDGQNRAAQTQKLNYQGKAFYGPSRWGPEWAEMTLPAVEFGTKNQALLGLNASFVKKVNVEAKQQKANGIIQRNVQYPAPSQLFNNIDDWSPTFSPYFEVMDGSIDANACYAQWNIGL